MTRPLPGTTTTPTNPKSNEKKKYNTSLILPQPTASARASTTAAHPQLRHLLSCPARRGIVCYPKNPDILIKDLHNPVQPPFSIVCTRFEADLVCLATFPIAPTTPDPNASSFLLAAGSLQSDLHLSLHTLLFSPDGAFTHKLVWTYSAKLIEPVMRQDIVNAVLFVPKHLTCDPLPPLEEDAAPRLMVCSNDGTLQCFDILGLRRPAVKDGQRLSPCGRLAIDTPINHACVSPDGRTVVCVGDTPRAYLFALLPGAHLTFAPLGTYTLPSSPPPHTSPRYIPSTACFATAFAPDGSKFAIASQEGQLAVWDVRSPVPVWTYWAPRGSSCDVNGAEGEDDVESAGFGMGLGLGLGGAWNGLRSGIRSVLFTRDEHGGRELLIWAEHARNVHVLDARSFDPASHQVIHLPPLLPPPSPPPSSPPAHPSSLPTLSSQVPPLPQPDVLPGLESLSLERPSQYSPPSQSQRRRDTSSESDVTGLALLQSPTGGRGDGWIYASLPGAAVELRVRAHEEGVRWSAPRGSTMR